MGRLVVTNSITLDGVMQAPASPGEDRRDGFPYGGWAAPYHDESMAKAMGEGMGETGAMLFGRRTYEQFATFWPFQPDDNPYAKVLNAFPKYVASTTLREPLPWANSTLLKGDVVAAVRELKQRHDKAISILGSGELVRSLLPHGLIDELVLLIHPVALGRGRGLFTEHTALNLVKATTTATGVVIATYRAC
ncbi:dihydrofolate reductase family protein [Thermoactinospora rubra]|uniref:dihydrofolate reductase family protein n=1 Tax=Thermoactinospora rubra TaxID=1088767 RepID=UPI000A103EAF|nr:dihydrofolate reductase family protein [Thermoactinospora rubra]